jgi:hypothetical protein
MKMTPLHLGHHTDAKITSAAAMTDPPADEVQIDAPNSETRPQVPPSSNPGTTRSRVFLGASMAGIEELH